MQKQKIEVQAEHVERRVINKEHRYAGTLDLLAKINGNFGVLDIKTSQGIYRDYNIQTSAYLDALQDDFKDLQHRWILRIDQQQSCASCGASRRVKGGREKIKAARSLFNGFNGHYGVSSDCGKDKHHWGEIKGIIELKELPKDWRSDFKAFLGAKALWEWEHADWLKKIGY